MDFARLEKILKGEPEYRLKQVKTALFLDLIENWSEVTTLPILLREKLNKECSLEINAKPFVSKDKKTIKTLITLKDGLKIESVLMKHKDKRNTVCLSSQVGCPLGCVFCATGRAGFKRNLESFEIVEQVLFFARFLKNIRTLPSARTLKASPILRTLPSARTLIPSEIRTLPSARTLEASRILGEKITNIVFMGMGEPFLNYENVILAIRILNDKESFNLGARHISISTVGIIEGIEKLAGENLQVNLAISLNAPDNKLRSKIMPVNKKYPIEEILKAVDEYIKKTKRRVMFEYVMIKGLNDSDECAQGLAKLMKKPLYFVNLISHNPTGIFQPSLPQRIKKFREILEGSSVPVTQRFLFGQDVKAACGQLAGK